TVTFDRPGAYVFRVTITDAGGLTATSSVNVTQNLAPTVATAAAASPSTVTGTTTALSVLGADDGGGPDLRSTWALSRRPPGAHPPFPPTGTDAPPTVTVTFDRPGAYTFRVTIADAGGLTAASSVNVTQNLAPTVATAATATPSTVTGTTTALSVLGADDGG